MQPALRVPARKSKMNDDHRSRRNVRGDGFLSDLRFGLTSLRRDPAFAVFAIGLLALGMGATTAMFSVVDAVFLKPLPFPEPERMVRVWETLPNSARNSTTTLTFLDWKSQDDIFQALSVESPTRAAVTTEGSQMRVPGKLVSADYFDVFGVKPRLGRAFAPGEDQAGAAPVVVVSHAFWQTRLGGDPNVIGSDLLLDGRPHRIVGVLPAGTFDRDRAAFWKPLIFSAPQMNRDQHVIVAVGRLRAGVDLQQAQARMNVLRASLAGVMPAYKQDWGFAVDPFDQGLVSDSLHRSISLAFAAVLAVLLIACANLANLLLARGATRRKEMALRAALGASRGRLVAQLLTECLVLCVLGGALGVYLADLLLSGAAPLLRSSLPYTADVSLDLRVLAFASAIIMGVAIVAGLLPSVQTSFVKLSDSMKQEARGISSSRATLRRTIVIGQVAVSVVLIAGAALLFKSLAQLGRVDTGVRIERVVTMATDLPSLAYPTPASAANFYAAVVARLRAVPGVEEASVSQDLPLEGISWGEGMRVPGVGEPFGVRVKHVDARYFRTLQIPVESGRGFEEQDREGAPPVVVINQELARYLSGTLGIADPVGRTVDLEVAGYGRPESTVTAQIIGVIRNERTEGLETPLQNVAYVSLAQSPQPDVRILVRTASEPPAAMAGIREAVRKIDPNMPLAEVRTMEQVKEQSMLWAKQPAWVIAAFAAVAALLAALGLYGVLAHAVAQQRREIGIRMALGAWQGEVASQVLRGAFAMIVIGLAVGLAGALALTRVLKSLLFGVSPLDPVALAAACFLMTLVGMLAAWVPTSRAVRVDPMMVLRDEV